jgi:PAS domain S-box-containing protein
LQNIIDLLPVRIFWKDINLIYLGCNKVFAQDAGKNIPAEIIGNDDFKLGWKDQANLYREDDMKVIKSGVSKLDYIEPQTTPSGDTIWLNTNKVPFRNNSGQISGVVGTYLDITVRKKTEEMLRESEQRLNRAQSVSHVGSWELDLGTKKIWASEEAFRIYGIERKTSELPLEAVQNCVLPKYRSKLDSALELLITQGIIYNEEFEIKRVDDGNVRYIHSKAELYKNIDGKNVKVLGTIQDITDRKIIENEMLQKNQELERVNKSMINRELRMIELKEKIKELEEKLLSK